MTSGVKLPHYFLFIKVNRDVLLTLKLFRKQFQSTPYSVKCRQTSTVEYILNYFYFSLNVSKLELQYEWTPPQICFCEYGVLQLFYHNIEGAHHIKCCQK